MIPRGPYLPTPSVFLWVGLGLCMASAVSSPVPLAPEARTPLILLALKTAGFIPFVGLAALYPPLTWLGIVGPDARGSLRRRWALYLAAVGGMLLAIHVARNAYVGTLVGFPADATTFWVTMLSVPPVIVLLMAWGEQEAARRADVAAQEAAIAREVERLVRSREALLRARARRVDEVADSVRTRIVPQLAAVEARLAAARALAAGGTLVPGPALIAEARAVESVAEGEFRRLGRLMHPTIVRAGLMPALKSLIAQHPEGPLVALDLPATEPPAGADLPAGGVLAAYRIVEGALDNAQRHAPGARVAVTVTRPPAGGVVIAVRDDGPGFDPAQATWGAGFAAIDSRVQLAGGSWSVEAAPGAGTCVRATLPPATDVS